MSLRHDRVVRRLQQRLERCDSTGATAPWSVVSELEVRIRRLQSLGDEYSAVRVSDDVMRLCASGSLRCSGVT